jgi:hypothetical protein
MANSAIIPPNLDKEIVVQAAHGLGVANDWFIARETTAAAKYAKLQGDTAVKSEMTGCRLARVVDANTLECWKPGSLATMGFASVTAGGSAVADGDAVYASTTVAGAMTNDLALVAVGEFECYLGRFEGAGQFRFQPTERSQQRII